MKPESAKALVWTAAILIVLAFVIMSPTGTFALLVVAAVLAAIPSVFASKRPRVVSIVLLVASVALVVGFYPAFKRDRDAYAQHIKERAVTPQVSTTTDEPSKK